MWREEFASILCCISRLLRTMSEAYQLISNSILCAYQTSFNLVAWQSQKALCSSAFQRNHSYVCYVCMYEPPPFTMCLCLIISFKNVFQWSVEFICMHKCADLFPYCFFCCLYCTHVSTCSWWCMLVFACLSERARVFFAGSHEVHEAKLYILYRNVQNALLQRKGLCICQSCLRWCILMRHKCHIP